jgi:hypothetical protein
MEKITTELRVVSCVIKPFMYGGERMGEAMEVRASGFWEPSDSSDGPYPASLHITVYPGCGVVPMIGDSVKITIERGNKAL